MDTTIFQINPLQPDKELLKIAANILQNGGLVAFPTETVYGLGASVFNYKAVRRIYSVKQRPMDNPLIVHISTIDEIDMIAYDIPEIAYRLIDSFFPGPLTLILNRKEIVPAEVSAYLPTVAVRMPAFAIALDLIKELGNPIAAPSANKSTKISPVSAEHVLDDLEGEIEAIIDGGKTPLGLDSTVVNVLTTPPVILRPGVITLEELSEVVPEITEFDFTKSFVSDFKPLSPGMKYKHYAPNIPLYLYTGERKRIWEEIADRKLYWTKKGLKVGVVLSKEGCNFLKQSTDCFSLGSYDDLREAASLLYTTLREMEKDYQLILVEGCQEVGIGKALMNRLTKAASNIYHLV